MLFDRAGDALAEWENVHLVQVAQAILPHVTQEQWTELWEQDDRRDLEDDGYLFDLETFMRLHVQNPAQYDQMKDFMRIARASHALANDLHWAFEKWRRA